MSELDAGWPTSLPEDDLDAMEAAARCGVPSRSLAMYARWWQLETWLRQLAYVELRARDGQNWVANIDSRTLTRQARDDERAYMASPDWKDPLAYLDASQLLELIDRNWQLFAPSLISQAAWQGRKEELIAIRNRIGHLRRGHADDLNRLEQTLRDVEYGANRALVAYNSERRPTKDVNDPVCRAWLLEQHKDADLIRHAAAKHDARFILSYSLRPWAGNPSAGPITGTAGALWRVDLYLPRRYVDLGRLWRETYLDVRARRLMIHLLSNDDHHVAFTFPAMEDGEELADAIGNAFHAVLGSLTYYEPYWLRGEEKNGWRRPVPADPRVLTPYKLPWALVDETTQPITIFSAG